MKKELRILDVTLIVFCHKTIIVLDRTEIFVLLVCFMSHFPKQFIAKVSAAGGYL